MNIVLRGDRCLRRDCWQKGETKMSGRLQHIYFEFIYQVNVLQPDAFHMLAAHTCYAVSNRKQLTTFRRFLTYVCDYLTGNMT